MEYAYEALLTKGQPAHIHIASVIASQQAAEHIRKVFPEDKTTLWCGTIDPELNEHAYIVPGLGDAGDLCYGEKRIKRPRQDMIPTLPRLYYQFMQNDISLNRKAIYHQRLFIF